MNEVNLENVVWKEGKFHVAWNINTGVSSFGETKEEALESLQEALELHLEDIPVTQITKVEKAILVPSQLQYA